MKTARQLSLFLLLLTVAPAYYISLQMINDPSGSSLGMPAYLLNGTLLDSYAVGGWIMLGVVAVFGTITIIAIFLRTSFYSILIMLQGVLLCVFLFAQMLLLQDSFMIQYFLLIIGGGLIGLGALQNQRKIVVDNEKKFKVKSHPHKHRRK